MFGCIKLIPDQIRALSPRVLTPAAPACALKGWLGVTILPPFTLKPGTRRPHATVGKAVWVSYGEFVG